MARLAELRIRNLAVVEELDLEPGFGLNVLSGETGAGKSILMGAVELLFGGRGSTDLIRTGADQARVDGLFHFDDPEFFRKRGIDLALPDGTLLVTRELSRSGRSRILLNDELATLARLKSIGDVLADLHGQHEHQRLLHPETHIDYLDRFGVTAGTRSAAALTPLEAYRLARSRCADLRARLDALMNLGSVEERRDALDRDLKEIGAAAPRAGEEEELEAEHRMIAHAEKLASAVGDALSELSDNDEAAEARMGRAARRLAQGAALDPGLEPIVRTIDEALVGLQDAARELARYQDRLQFEPDRAEFIETRLALLRRLRKKFNRDAAGLLEHVAVLRKERESLVDEAAAAGALEKEMARAAGGLLEAGAKLRTWREAAARKLEKGVGLELSSLGMPKARFSVKIEDASGVDAFRNGQHGSLPGERGLEQVEFFLEANPGEGARPLARTASGGELSRIMLALKAVLQTADPQPILVFDEVDAGIGGRVASQVGDRLKEISAGRQLFVITHLPMIACHADTHFQVSKQVLRGRTVTTVQPLTDRQREEELARMLAGAESGEEAVHAARALLAGARKGSR